MFLDLGEMVHELWKQACLPCLAAMMTGQKAPEHLKPILRYVDDSLHRMNKNISAQDLRLGEIRTKTSENCDRMIGL